MALARPGMCPMPGAAPGPAATVSPSAAAGRLRGRIKIYDPARGFGFIRPHAAAPDLFFHASQFEDDLPPLVGEFVEFIVEHDPQTGKLRAAAVRLISDRGLR